MPAFDFQPDSDPHEVVLLLDDAGGQSAFDPGSTARNLLREGKRVFVAELPGLGGSRPAAARPHPFDRVVGPEWQVAEMAYLLGQNLAGFLAEAILICARHVRARPGTKLLRIETGQKAALAALHAVALEPELFDSVRIPRVENWSEAIRNAELKLRHADTIPGALAAYDISDLVRMIPSRKLA